MEVINAIGRRKSAVARIYVKEGSGNIVINKRELANYFPSPLLQYIVNQPLNLLNVMGKYDIKVNLCGGGFTGQSQALRRFQRTGRGTPPCDSACSRKDKRRGQAHSQSCRFPHTRRTPRRAQETWSAESPQAFPVLETLTPGVAALLCRFGESVSPYGSSFAVAA